MPGVTKKTKQKAVAKTSPVKEEKKFISESLQNKKPKKGSQKKTPKHRRRGVVYIKHLPHGFYEEQLRGYFSQFGAITRMRLARSPKTLGSKGFAFIEFRYPEVAEIAADAMNNYLMFKNIIKTRYIPPSDIKHDYFRSSVKKVKKDGEKVLTSKSVEARETVVLNTNKLLTEEDEKARTKKIGSKISKQKQKLTALGIDYDVDEVAANMGDEVMEAASRTEKKEKTEDGPSKISEDADESLDAENLDIDSDDDFEDFEYDSEASDDEESVEKIEVAVKKARGATKTANIEVSKEVAAAEKKDKRKGNTAEEEKPDVPLKKTKGSSEEESKKANDEEPKKTGKKGKAATVKLTEDDTPEVSAAAKKGKKSPVNKKPEEVQAKKPAGKKNNNKTVSPVQAPVKSSKRIKAQAENTATEVNVPEQKGKGKKGKNAAPVSPPAKPDPKKAVKKTDSQPAKTKKLAKASAAIEKKKPATKADNKKLKLAANAATSTEGAEIVKVVKGNEIKGKKKTAKK